MSTTQWPRRPQCESLQIHAKGVFIFKFLLFLLLEEGGMYTRIVTDHIGRVCTSDIQY